MPMIAHVICPLPDSIFDWSPPEDMMENAPITSIKKAHMPPTIKIMVNALDMIRANALPGFMASKNPSPPIGGRVDSDPDGGVAVGIIVVLL